MWHTVLDNPSDVARPFPVVKSDEGGLAGKEPTIDDKDLFDRHNISNEAWYIMRLNQTNI